MRRVLVTGAGGAASIGFTRSLKIANANVSKYYVVGADSNRFKACLSEADETHIIPRPSDPGYIDALNEVVDKTGVEFVHAQPWQEVRTISMNRGKLHAKTFLPDDKTVQACSNKYESYLAWRDAGLKVPKTLVVKDEADISLAFADGEEHWIRAYEGAGGLGAVKTNDSKFAAYWIGIHNGWGTYTVSEYLSPRSTTWMSLWKDGELIVAQGRERLYWEYSSKFLSGVSGVTGACKTISDPTVDDVALKVVKATDPKPNGIFSIDLTYDKEGNPNPTEINIGKFFTTCDFFTRAGVNFPDIYMKLAFDEPVEPLGINPLPHDLVWIRGVDSQPVLTSMEKIKETH